MPNPPTQQEIRSAADYIGRAMAMLEETPPRVEAALRDLSCALLELGHIRIVKRGA